MKYNAKDASQVIPAGTYDASIKAYTETREDGSAMTTKNGDPMCRVRFEVYVGDQARTLSDYFIGGKMIWRYKRLAQAIGQEQAFKDETFSAENHIGENLRIELTVEESDEYGEQNRIAKFLPKASGTVDRVNTPAPDRSPVTADDIPF